MVPAGHKSMCSLILLPPSTPRCRASSLSRCGRAVALPDNLQLALDVLSCSGASSLCLRLLCWFLQAMSALPEGSQQRLQLQVVQLQERISELEQEQHTLQADLVKQKALSAKGAGQQHAAAAVAGGQQLRPVDEDEEAAVQPAAVIGGGLGLKPIRTQRSVDPNASLTLLPGTPNEDKLKSRGRLYSSSGGGSAGATPHSHSAANSNSRKPSRLGSSSGVQNSGGVAGALDSSSTAGAGAGQHTAAAAAAVMQGIRPGSAEPAGEQQQPQQQQQQHSQSGGLSRESSGGLGLRLGGVSYASQQWEESKQLQARLDSLRWAL